MVQLQLFNLNSVHIVIWITNKYTNIEVHSIHVWDKKNIDRTLTLNTEY